MNKVTITDAMLAKLSPSERINWLTSEMQGWRIVLSDRGWHVSRPDGEGVYGVRETFIEAFRENMMTDVYAVDYTSLSHEVIDLMDDSMSLYKLDPRQGKGLYACGLFTEDSEWIGHVVSKNPALAICGMYGYANEVDFMPLIKQIDSEAYEEGLE